MRILPPKIDPRKANDVLRALREMVPHYTREWSAKDDDDPGVALLKIFSSIAEGVISRLNRAPERNFLAFLDMLGIRLLQARPAHVPVKFIVADGTENAFLIAKGTQVSAPPTEPRTEDLPFETIENLLTIPATLTSMFAVDPELDKIYQPPPGFLELTLAATTLPELTVMAFSAAGTKNLQLDPPEQVKKDDFLRVDQKVSQRSGPDQCVPFPDEKESSQSEHFVVDDVKGAVVTLADPLKRDYVEGTTVRKITQFELFEAKNWQEHILFLAHNEYFAIKSEAQITIRVQHAPGASSNLQPLKVVWEFFGSVEALKDEPDTWHEFQVDADGTQGLSRDGQIALTKPEGEIKETELDGRKSRWIRARLDQSLPATPATPVPKIELIDFAVSSGGEKLQPDKAFHNDTPLTTDVAFFPFGTEPRIFDRFSIASEEAFSKPNADIDLTFSLDTTELLASPSGFHDDKKLRIFARALAGRLLEFQIAPGTLDVQRHLSPADQSVPAGSKPAVIRLTAGATPAVVTFNKDIAVLVRADDGKIYLRFIPSQPNKDPQWKSLPITPGTLQSDPAAVLALDKWHVFAVADNRLYKLELTPATVADAPADADLESSWTPAIDGPEIDSNPFVLAVGGSVRVFVTDVKGRAHIYDLNANSWTPLVANYEAAKKARPFARFGLGQTRVFLRTTAGNIVVIDPNNLSIPPLDLGQPSSGVNSNPHGSPDLSDPIFVRGEDSHLWSTTDSASAVWVDHRTTRDIDLDGDPFVIKYTSGAVSVLSTSTKNALMEFRTEGAPLAGGNIAAGPKSIVFLKNVPSTNGTYYIHILDGPGVGSNNDAVRKTDLAAPMQQFVVLDSPLDEIPTTGTQYELLRQEATGTVQGATSDTLTLQSIAGVNIGDFVFAGKLLGSFQLRIIDGKPGGNVVHVSEDWDPSKPLETYVILRVDVLTQGEKVKRPSAVRAVLPASAQNPTNDVYKDKFLRITAGPGASSAGRRIDAYFSNTNNVVLQSPFLEPPTTTSIFVITITREGNAWFVHEDKNQPEVRPELSWEYWNGKGWLALKINNDETRNLLVNGTLSFTLPDNVAKTEVAGQESFWIRARIVGGDFGREQFSFNVKTGELKIEKDPIRPPKVQTLDISYKVTEQKEPQICLTLNSLNYLDQTAANVTPNKNFYPYVPLTDEGKTLYFGFDRSFSGAPVKIYFAAKELEVDERSKPKVVWAMAFENDWKELIAEDGTEGFTRPDYVTLDVAEDFQNTQQLGKALFWLRASLAEGQWVESPLLSGVFVNSVEALQARTVREEILGSSTGIKNQKFAFQQTPVIEGEEVRVREALTDEERDELINTYGEDFVFIIRDQQDRILETWVKWSEVVEFYDSVSTSRDYRLDRHTGEIEFGDGIHGRIPPVGGDNIRAFTYQAGGGAAGNVKAGEIDTAVTAVAGVDSVINPVAAGGGSDAATNEDMLTIGPAQISHRERAVTPEDFERLALEASREVRKARCLPNRNAKGRHELGWTTIQIVPDSQDAEPVPSLELRRSVQRYLADRADLTLVDQKHIVVGPPKYVTVSIEGQVFAKSLDDVATADQRAKKELEAFLHPLSGGPESEGWEFGRDLAASDLYSLLESIDEVDHVGPLRLIVGGSQQGEQVSVDADALIAGGTHKITTLASGE